METLLINQRFLKRQKPIGRYIVDFVCLKRRLIIEIDGDQHSEQVAYDQHRDAWLRSQGYTVLRFWNNDVMQPLEGVLEQIRPLPQPASPPSLRSPHKWERGVNA